MTFFDKKEEVIDIELTQYGKYLLSKGKFKPIYYQFFDDDIIYDSRYATGGDEPQKDIQQRIKEAPRPHVQYSFVSSEDEIKKHLEQVRRNTKTSFSDIYVPYSIKHRAMGMPLGHSEIGQQKTAAWKLRSFRNQISESLTFITGTYSNSRHSRLILEDIKFDLQVASDSENTIYVPGDANDTLTETRFTPTSDLNNLSTRFEDNTYIRVKENYILLDLQELNVAFSQENFDIELYNVLENELGEEQLDQLYFNKRYENVVDGLLIEAPDNLTDFKQNRTEMAATYFIIQADREIDTTVLCNNLPLEDKQILVATNQLDLECEDLYGSLGDPRIKSDVRPEDLGENC